MQVDPEQVPRQHNARAPEPHPDKEAGQAGRPSWIGRLAHPALPLAVLVVLAVSSLVQKSPTYDEPIILASGAHYLRRGDPSVNAENPPLLKALYALPTLCLPGFRSAPVPESLGFSYSMAEEFEWANLSLCANPHPERLVILCRLMGLLPAVFLGVLLYVAASRCWGARVGLAILWVYCLSPNILAHARLTTPDMGCAAAVFATSLCLWGLLTRQRLGDALALGLFLGVALLSKFTAVLLLPCLVVQSGLFLWLRGSWRRWQRPAWLLGVAFLVALLSIGALYGFRGLGVTLQGTEWRSPLVLRLQSVPVLRSLPLPVPEAYIRGFDIVAFNNKPGLPNIFLGELYPEGGSWWYYYLVVPALKIPLPLLALLLFSLACACMGGRRLAGTLLFFALVPLVFWANFSFVAYRQLGLRYILPVWPYLLFFCGFGLVWVRSHWQQRPVRWGTAAALAWFVAGTLWTHPDYLSYFNEVAGGPDHGWRLLAESNTDWGQDLPALRRWRRANGDPDLGLLYYGSWPPRASGIDSVPWATVPPPPFLAISVTNYYLYRDVPLVAFLRDHVEPVARAGRSIHVHAITGDVLDAFLQAHGAAPQ